MMYGLRNGHKYSFEYKNHRGEVATRTVIFGEVQYGQIAPYYPEPTFLFACFDLDKEAERTFAVEKITPGSWRAL